MLYLIIDLTTGEVVDKARTPEVAERKASALDSVRSWVDGHTFGYVLETINPKQGKITA